MQPAVDSDAPAPAPTSARTFAERFAEVRRRFGPLVLGLDPSPAVLADWGLPDGPVGLERFARVAVEAAAGRCGVVKPQSAFFERHGSRGMAALERLLSEARDAGLLTLLDVKRGDIGSTNEAYAEAYLAPDAPLRADALTVAPYLGFEALEPFFVRAAAAGAAVFVVVRSSNAAGRVLQSATGPNGRSVEERLLSSLGMRNAVDGVPSDGIGALGAVFAPNHGPPQHFDLAEVRGLFLAPGLGAQGAAPADLAACFAACPRRVLPAASRSLLAAGPDPSRLAEALVALGTEVREALGA